MKYIRNYGNHIAEKLEKLTGYKATVYPPMGLRASIGIALNDGGELKGFITLTCTENIIYYDTGKVKERYPQGSIGELNGFGNETKPLPDSIDEIWKIMKEKR